MHLAAARAGGDAVGQLVKDLYNRIDATDQHEVFKIQKSLQPALFQR